MQRRLFAIIGLGTFGSTIAKELARLGHQVLGVDFNERQVDAMAEFLTHAVIADATNERALEELDLGRYDTAVVAIGENVEASILCTMQLKTIGLRQVWVKALTDRHYQILAKLGADRIIRPEYEMGVKVAQALDSPMVNAYIGLGDERFVVEVTVSERLHDTSLQQAVQTTGTGITALLVKRAAGMVYQPEAEFVLSLEDRVILEGPASQLRKFFQLL